MIIFIITDTAVVAVMCLDKLGNAVHARVKERVIRATFWTGKKEAEYDEKSDVREGAGAEEADGASIVSNMTVIFSDLILEILRSIADVAWTPSTADFEDDRKVHIGPTTSSSSSSSSSSTRSSHHRSAPTERVTYCVWEGDEFYAYSRDGSSSGDQQHLQRYFQLDWWSVDR
ncbi:hypothetical protein AXG93_3242s1200 [Marchantia polymorpha subsp. ruderalis]|uniref:Uncharacterized protein n=1 Tax=Marchantia polymorpha subsp. ruderalis TaxID=1480154 RepID=A0A176WGX4_MARPO|nr:hypothetical protein AXG93_3242s1200 [Marchantia polymorpha subsp. ruderalis]